MRLTAVYHPNAIHSGSLQEAGYRYDTEIDDPARLAVDRAQKQLSNLLHKEVPAYQEHQDRSSIESQKKTLLSEFEPGEGGNDLELRLSLLSKGFVNVLCIGHPYLQYDADLPKSFFKKYSIKTGQSYVFPRDSPILQEFMSYVTEPPKSGGEALKTAEAIQWVCSKNPKSVAFLGAVGNDFGREVSGSLRDMSVAYKMEKKSSLRSSLMLVARLGERWADIYIFDHGASSLSLSIIDKPQITRLLETSEILFICLRSYLVTKMSLERIAYFASSSFKTVVMQLCSGVHVAGVENTFKDVIKYVDIFFTSKEMAVELVATLKLPCCYKSPAAAACKLNQWISSQSKKSCSVIVYDGIKQAYIASDDTKVKKVKNKTYSQTTVVDMYGYESAFVGGYLSQMIEDRGTPPENNVMKGLLCASAMVRQQGAQF